MGFTAIVNTKPRAPLLIALCVVVTLVSVSLHISGTTTRGALPANLQHWQILAQCALLNVPAGPSPDFHARTTSDRFAHGTKPTLITNATIWTGAHNGTEIVYGDLLLDRGLVKALGYIAPHLVADDVVVIDADRAWVTPGLGEALG